MWKTSVYLPTVFHIEPILLGISRVIIGGPIYSEEISKLRVNQGIWKSGRNGVLIGLTITCLMITPPVMVISIWNFEHFPIVLSLGIVMGGLVIGWIFGGAAFVQHFTLRFLLWRQRSMPLRYADFLNYASDRLFMQKVGGGYIFIHRMLLEHFAQMPLSNDVSTKVK